MNADQRRLKTLNLSLALSVFICVYLRPDLIFSAPIQRVAQAACPHSHSISGVPAWPSQKVLQYFAVVTQLQLGWAHFLVSAMDDFSCAVGLRSGQTLSAFSAGREFLPNVHTTMRETHAPSLCFARDIARGV